MRLRPGICRLSSRWFNRISLAAIWLGVGLRLAIAGMDLQDMEQAAIQAAVDRVSPAVVQVETLGGLEAVDGYLANQGPTTGILLDEQGHVLTSAINFIQAPSAILIHTEGGSRLPARILGQDHARKLVLLKFEPDQPLQVADISPREGIQVGASAIALGKAVDPKRPNVSFGIISAVNRVWGRAIQTDAKISPLNYGGPLIDIRGRILGILVPLSPDGNSTIAGTEWYDSGIGFAVPLSDITSAQLARMKEGQDLRPGLMGITLKGQNTYADPPIIALCPPGSPAGKAGLRAEDQILSIDGIPVKTHADVRHVIGTKMAGDRIQLEANRASGSWQGEFELVESIPPYDLPFLGILAGSESSVATADNAPPASPGVLVRHVFPGSAAETAGFKITDRVVKINETEITSETALREALSRSLPGDKVTFSCLRQSASITLQATLQRQSEKLDGDIPVREGWRSFIQGIANPSRPLKQVDIVIPEEEGKCSLWIPLPEEELGKYPLGLAIWLGPPGVIDEAAFQETWGPTCLERGIAILAPRPRHNDRWDSQDAEFIRKTLEHAIKRLGADTHRVVLIGDGVGGSMAYFYGFTFRQRTRGIAIVDATIPLRIELRGNDPENRLTFLIGHRLNFANADAMKADAARLRGMRFPVVDLPIESPGSSLAAKEIMAILAWLDAIDRI